MECDLAGRRVGTGVPLFVIAEIGLNHGGQLERALALVDAAATGRASAVKLQSLRGDRLVAASAPPPAHVRVASLQAFFATFELDRDAHRAIALRARERGLGFLSTPFDEEAVGDAGRRRRRRPEDRQRRYHAPSPHRHGRALGPADDHVDGDVVAGRDR